MLEGSWLPARHSDVYHGRSDGPDGSAWIYPRCHTGAGLFVEVHRDREDGPVVFRRRVAHTTEAAEVVEDLRRRFRSHELDVDTDRGDEMTPRGSCVLHRPMWGPVSASMPYGRMDDGPDALLCVRIWAEPGPHRVIAGYGRPGVDGVPASAMPQHVEIEPYREIELHLGYLRTQRLVWGRSRGHRCGT